MQEKIELRSKSGNSRVSDNEVAKNVMILVTMNPALPPSLVLFCSNVFQLIQPEVALSFA